jgi:hypothetical protein
MPRFHHTIPLLWRTWVSYNAELISHVWAIGGRCLLKGGPTVCYFCFFDFAHNFMVFIFGGVESNGREAKGGLAAKEPADD